MVLEEAVKIGKCRNGVMGKESKACFYLKEQPVFW